MPVTNYPPTSVANGGTGSSTAAGALSNLGGFPSASILRSYLAANKVYNNNDVLANTLLSVTLVASGVYQIDIVLFITGAVVPPLVDLAGGTATVTNLDADWLCFDMDGGTAGGAARATTLATPFSNATADITNGLEYRCAGTIEVNAGGTFILRGAQTLPDPSNTNILRDSYMILTKMT